MAMTIAPDDQAHGTPNGYQRGCRDTCCRTAIAYRNKTLRKQQAQHVVEQLAHTLGRHARPNWENDAACHNTGVDLFFPDEGDSQGAAKAIAICHTCPVRTDCLNHNLHETDGIWGATTPMQRRALRRWLNDQPHIEKGMAS